MKDVDGFPGYAIDRNGVVFRTISGQVTLVRLRTDKDGYREAYVWRNGRRYYLKVHHLVLAAFVGPKMPGMVCRHLDGNPANNHVGNLCWGTPKENAADRVRHGRGNYVPGELNPAHKLTAEQVREIRKEVAGGELHKDVATRFGIHRAHVSKIVARHKWKALV